MIPFRRPRPMFRIDSTLLTHKETTKGILSSCFNPVPASADLTASGIDWQA